jgi:hypothetical protein
MATRRTDPSYRILEQNANTNQRRSRRTDPSYKILEQNADTNQRRLTRQTNSPERRAQENERNAASKLWQQDVLIHHAGYWSKTLILIKED